MCRQEVRAGFVFEPRELGPHQSNFFHNGSSYVRFGVVRLPETGRDSIVQCRRNQNVYRLKCQLESPVGKNTANRPPVSVKRVKR